MKSLKKSVCCFVQAVKEAEKAAAKEAEKKAEVAKLEVAETKALKSQGSGGALGKVSGSASGGKVLEKEEVSADVLNMLKV